ncbi:cyclic nucleotide-binding domain-containing protein [Desulfatitalea alkaliphila]|uniref:Cyclic nucleotide-binding domain-containing protein n=1 Tax=Desulfatitalea alkaliphila TaxID=2929485 RepID=A0AA41UHY6_9BACT|nr:cyclic nucleotide-binding domain-containing protein [Desulfatitalea alkaliphila]MCJ8499499.1 cyclic nucleotide-binding domain-containing protein [Desulfatitalea alkaliphila]
MNDDDGAKQQAVKALLKAGRKDKALDLLFEAAMAHARAHAFAKAEALRDRMYEVDSFALSQITSLNALIEDKKSKALTPALRQRWDRFFKGLSAEEANAFFFGLQTIIPGPDETLLQQGRANDRLYLINEGQVQLFHDNGNKRLFIKSLGPGDTVGEDTFFSVNVCTFSAVCLGNTALSYLDRSRLAAFKHEFPLMGKKLKAVCEVGRGIFSWLRQKGLDRRRHKRIHFSTKAVFQVLPMDDRERPGSPVTAEIWDISKSGLSFYFHAKNAQAMRRLIGRTLQVRFKVPLGERPKTVTLIGLVQGVQSHPLDEYSVHLKLQRNLSDDAIKTISAIAAGMD